ncbi:hypothetical protein POX_d05819 [Penicillium oxalicum]|uniref:Uncharacterized protein n=1 Tax=Penicillium oxalicum (strain 114-2 / CGMCC 5302) TaxID=933388 RepID=S7ZMW0_PENO1|nr:hypothetical protein POX_d05819 [Penicillium oxalicum]EPS32005.1 hypothetical protein PDE_06964 [Penicillium oxalicum 114-2]KAI2790310.1 hypothetical protein POX_d05819 [Penicillium oxalicum]
MLDKLSLREAEVWRLKDPLRETIKLSASRWELRRGAWSRGPYFAALGQSDKQRGLSKQAASCVNNRCGISRVYKIVHITRERRLLSLRITQWSSPEIAHPGRNPGRSHLEAKRNMCTGKRQCDQ